jgi:20S proteasome subunit alpha 7
MIVFSTVIGLRCKNGVVIAVEKLLHSKLLVPGSNHRLGSVDRHVGLVRSMSSFHDFGDTL